MSYLADTPRRLVSCNVSNKEALWSNFKASLATPKTVASEPSTRETIKIEKRYRFAGEDVV